MTTFIKRLMAAARQYTVWDFVCLKISLLCFGIILGVYFSRFFARHTLSLWFVFLIAFALIFYRTYVKHMK